VEVKMAGVEVTGGAAELGSVLEDGKKGSVLDAKRELEYSSILDSEKESGGIVEGLDGKKFDAGNCVGGEERPELC
jgi:hypothetical protein